MRKKYAGWGGGCGGRGRVLRTLAPPPTSSPSLIPIHHGAGAFTGDHPGSQGMGRGAGLVEQGAFTGPHHPPEDIAAAAGRGRWRGNPGQNVRKAPPGVILQEFLPDLNPATRDNSQAPPFCIHGGKDLLEERLGPGIGLHLYGPGVDVVHLGLAPGDLAQDRIPPRAAYPQARSRSLRKGRQTPGG